MSKSRHVRLMMENKRFIIQDWLGRSRRKDHLVNILLRTQKKKKKLKGRAWRFEMTY